MQGSTAFRTGIFLTKIISWSVSCPPTRPSRRLAARCIHPPPAALCLSVFLLYLPSFCLSLTPPSLSPPRRNARSPPTSFTTLSHTCDAHTCDAHTQLMQPRADPVPRAAEPAGQNAAVEVVRTVQLFGEVPDRGGDPSCGGRPGREVHELSGIPKLQDRVPPLRRPVLLLRRRHERQRAGHAGAHTPVRRSWRGFSVGVSSAVFLRWTHETRTILIIVCVVFIIIIFVIVTSLFVVSRWLSPLLLGSTCLEILTHYRVAVDLRGASLDAH